MNSSDDGPVKGFFGGLQVAVEALLDGGKRATWTLVGGGFGLGLTLLLFDQSWFVASELTKMVLGTASMSLGSVLGRDKDRRAALALMAPPTRLALPPGRDEQ